MYVCMFGELWRLEFERPWSCGKPLRSDTMPTTPAGTAAEVILYINQKIVADARPYTGAHGMQSGFDYQQFAKWSPGWWKKQETIQSLTK